MKSRPKKIFRILVPAIAAVALLFLLLPVTKFDDPYSKVLFDRNGKLLGARIAADGQWRFPPVDSVPEKFKTAIIAYEDKRFYSHPGLDILAIARAVRENYRSGEIVSGGSTISQQVVRLAGKGRKRTYAEKIREAFLALRLEQARTKDEILQLYASHCPLGGNTVGLEAAAWRYFGRDPFALSWAESATLAVLPNAPALIHPGKNRHQLLAKRNELLKRLYQNKSIDSITYTLAKLENLPGAPKRLPDAAPHFLAFCKNNSHHSRINSSIDEAMQLQLNKIVKEHGKKLEENQIHNAAVLILEVESGNVMAYVGNTDDANNRHENYVDVIQSPRSYGSLLKPLLYASMLDEGMILPNTLVPDIPTFIAGYSPRNFDLGYRGVVPASKALVHSLNIPAVRMLKNYGLEKFQYTLQKLGFTTLDKAAGHYGLTLILGGGECSLWEITGVYASLARQLNHFIAYSSRYDPADIHMPRFINNRENTQSREQRKFQTHHLISAGAVYQTFRALLEVNRPAQEAGWEYFSSSRKIAWKTGTSFGFRDGWAVGITPGYVVGVWTGNADGEGRPGLIGIKTAAPIMFDVFSMLPNQGWFDSPGDEFVKIEVCTKSGHRAGAFCDEKDSMHVLKKGLQSGPCPYHQLVHLDQEEKYRINRRAGKHERVIHKSWFVLPPVMAWYHRKVNPLYADLPPFRENDPQKKKNAMDFIYPAANSKIYVPWELDGSPGELVLEAAHRSQGSKIYWHLDEEYLGETSRFHQMAVRPDKGEHKLTIIDQHGEMKSLEFVILSEE